MKSAKPSTETSKGPRGASTVAPASGDQPTIEEILLDPTVAVDLAADDTTDPTVASPLSLHAMMETFITTQAAHRRLIDKLLTEVATLRVDFAKYMSRPEPK